MWHWRFGKKSTAEQDIDEELQAHLDIEIKLLMERGLSQEEATAHAHRSFGNRTRIAEDARQAWRWAWLDRFLQDLNYGVRTLRQSPIFAVAAVLSLALGIGAATAVFSIADTVFLRPLPYPRSEQLMWVANRFPRMDVEFLASPDYVAWRRDNRVFEQLAATQAHGGETVLLNSSDPRELHLVRVSSNFLKTLGVRPAIGRDFRPKEELPNGPKAVLLSTSVWQHQFHGHKDIAGKTVTLDGQPYTVIGVLPSSFVFPMDVRVDVMTTLPVSPTASHHDLSMSTWAVYGRLKPDIAIARARADLERLFALSKADIPLMFRSDTKLVLESLQEHRVGNARVLLSILIASVSCLLLIACANVSNLLLGRWSARSGEFAIRAAIGAGRGRLARQLLTEAGLLTVLGWVLGAVLVGIMLSGFAHYAAGELPRLSEIAIDKRVLAIGLVVSALTTLLFGVLPILRVWQMDIQSELQQPGRPGLPGGHSFTKRALLVAEVALSLMLLCGATLLLESLWHLKNDHLGFEPQHVLSVSIPLKGTKLAAWNRTQTRASLVEFIRRVPGVEDAAESECTPLSAGPLTTTFSRTDRPLPEAFHRGDNIHVCGASAGYTSASGMRIVHGRFFTDSDFQHPNSLAVINEAAVRAYFPGEDPIGKRIIGGPQGPWKTVIGIVSDTKNQGLDAVSAPQAFVNGQAWPDATQLQLIVGSIGDQRGIESAITDKLRSLDPGLIANFEPIDQAITEMTSGPRFNGILVASFAAIAFLMAVLGVYGVLAFAVTQRTQEIGIRMALGAQHGRMLGLVLYEGMMLVFIGVALGLSAVIALMRYMKPMLYGITSTDLGTLAIVALGLTIAAGTAMFLPARRAASVEPVIALRHT